MIATPQTNHNLIVVFLSFFLILPHLIHAQEGDTIAKDRSFAIYPALGYQPETSVQFGALAVVVLANRDQSQSQFERQTSLPPYFLYTLRNQILAASNLDIYFRSGFNLNITPRFFNFPDLYFGIGNKNDPEIAESYSNVFLQIEGNAMKPYRGVYFFGAAFDVQHTKIKDIIEGGLLDIQDPEGVNGGNLFGLGPAFRYDTRDNVIYPTTGHLINLQTIINPIGEFSYARYLIDIRKYVSTKDQQNIFAFQINANLMNGERIPFYKLPQLGGDERLRGIENASLYRDRQSIYMQMEYRRPLFWRFGGVAFAGLGDVANSIGDFDISSTKYIVGLGGRFAVIPEKKLNIRGDIGISNEGQIGIYIGMREAF